MAKCPTCDAVIEWDARACRICATMFGDGSHWRPIGESRDEKQKLRERHGAPEVPRSSNPYAAPEAALDDGADGADGRPGWVWAITIFFGLGTAWNMVSTVLIVTATMPLDEGGRAYWNSLTIFDHVLTLVNSGVSLAGIVLLFLMRARATTFLMASLVISALSTVYHLFAKNFVAMAGTVGLVSVVVGFLIWTAVVWYAYRLRDAGRLR
jgi:hypothetical protein